MKPEIKQQLKRNANFATSCVGAIFAIGLIPFVLFIIIPGFLSLASSGFDLNPTTNPSAIFTLAFSGLMTLMIVLGIWAFLKYRNAINTNLDNYLQAAENLQIEVDPNQIVFSRSIPFSGGTIAFSSPTGLGTYTKQGKTFQIFHNYEQKNTPKMIKGGLSTYYSATPVTMIETTSAKHFDQSFMLVRKANLQGAYSGYQFSYRLIDLDNEYAVLDYQDKSTVTPEDYIKRVKEILGPDFLSKFSRLPGQNSLLYHQSSLRLHHENFATENELGMLFSFLDEVSN